MEHPTIEIPKFLEHLPTWNSFPIPFTTFVHEGKPDFRVTDTLRWQECAHENLCAICGIVLGEYSYFIGGNRTLRYKMFYDPAMHEPCAEFASKVCPFLNGNRTEYRRFAGPGPEGVEITT